MERGDESKKRGEKEAEKKKWMRKNQEISQLNINMGQLGKISDHSLNGLFVARWVNCLD